MAYAEHPWPYPTVVISWPTALFKGSNTPNANFDELAFNDFDARRTIELPGKSTDEDDDIGVILVLLPELISVSVGCTSPWIGWIYLWT